MLSAPNRITIETGTTALTDLSVYAVGFLTDTVIASWTAAPGMTLAGDAVTTATWPKGMFLEVNLSALTLTSGTVVLYERRSS